MCAELVAGFFVLRAGNGVADRREAVLQGEARGIQWRTSIIGQGTADCQAVAPDRFSFWLTAFFQGSFERPHSSYVFLQLRFGMAIGFVERIDGIFEGMKLTELMGRLGEAVMPPRCRWFLLHRKSPL